MLHLHLLDDNAVRLSEMSMDWLGDLIELGFRSLIGFGVLFGLLFWAFNVQGKMWRALVARYGQAKQRTVLGRKFPETIVIYNSSVQGWQLGGRPKYTTYFGTTISALDNGLLISAIPPIKFIYPFKDIYLPFNEMKIGPHPWMLWNEAYAISMDKASDLKVIISQDTLQWLRRNTGRAPFHP
ncbi:MAG: hypothetical protein WCH83_14120 [Alphaproteobacteria bacterium]